MMHMTDDDDDDDVSTVTSELSYDEVAVDSLKLCEAYKKRQKLPMIDWYYDVKKPSCKNNNKNKSIKSPKKVLPLDLSKVLPLDLSKVDTFDKRTLDEDAKLEIILREQLMESLRERLMEPTARHHRPVSSYMSRLSRGFAVFHRQTLGFLKKMIV